MVPDGRRLGIGRGGILDPGSLGDSGVAQCHVQLAGEGPRVGGHSEQHGAVGSAHGGTRGFLVCEVALLWSSNRSR